MIKQGLWSFRGRRVLLLQGPIGPFFHRLAVDLRNEGAHVFKINFNGGDCLFYPRDATAFRGTREEWPGFFKEYLEVNEIEIVLLFGDCRPLHLVAHGICTQQGVEVGVFEEGYLRPDYISFERYGVNGHSLLPRDPKFYRGKPIERVEVAMSVGNVFWHAMIWAMLYNTASRIRAGTFPYYSHHRTLTIFEGLRWLRSFWRKIYYAFREQGIEEQLVTKLSSQFFLVPLQVHNDAQIYQHSDFSSVKEFIHTVLDSFAASAPPETKLVIKHHPLDRGFSDYTDDIEKRVRKNKLEGRVFYIHDQHLPTLLRHARGVVTINSTVGLSALHHRVPLKTCGKAIYDISGMVFAGTLAEFWQAPRAGDIDLFRHFRNYLIRQTQLNGSFYRRLPLPDSHAGILWEKSQDLASFG